MDNSLGYFLFFYYYALRGIFRKQDLCLPADSNYFKKNFVLTPAIVQQWGKLFEVDAGLNKIPFTYHWPEFEKFYLKTMDELRFNYRNILHLGHEITFCRDSHGIHVNETVNLVVGIKDIVWLDRDRVVILIEGRVENVQGEEITKSLDTVFLKGLSEKNITELKNNARYNRTDISSFKSLSKRKPMLQDAQISSFHVPKNFGVRYGKISGDRNPLHTSEWLAKLFGYPHAFIQGSATVNFLIKYFIGERKEQLSMLNIKFCQPIFLGQTVNVYSTSDAFEVVDQNKKLLAFGALRRN